MNLSTETMAALHKASRKHKAIEIDWPRSQQPIAGHTYKLKNSETRIRVEKFYRTGWKALVRLDHDPIHLLHGLKGSRNASGDYETEPEAVHSTDQKLLDRAGRQVTVIQGAERRREARKLRMADTASRKGAPKWLRNIA